MTGTDIATHHGSTALTIAPEQASFTPTQVAALQQLGVADASPADLDVFFHVAKRAGLDPFARQIHMVSRKSNRPDGNGGWVSEVKQTIQTGIDGYRLIARRAADRAGIHYHVTAPQWFDHEGKPHPIWIGAFGQWPAACAITVVRDGDEFPAVAMFAEYVQTTGRGDNLRPNSMWSQRPAGQLAKCAEALALRMAFPHDLAGVYVDAEVDVMEDNPNRVVQPGTGAPVPAADRLRARMGAAAQIDPAANTPQDAQNGPQNGPAVEGGPTEAPPARKAATARRKPAPEPEPEPPADDVEPDPVDPAPAEQPVDAEPMATTDQVDRIVKGFRALGLRAGSAKAQYVQTSLGHLVTLEELTEAQAATILDSMAYDQAHGGIA